MEVSSTFQSDESIVKYRAKYDVSGTFDEGDVILEPVRAGEYVTSVHTAEPSFFYMYTSLINNFNLFFPFTRFEGSMLRALNVAPTQLHPSSWAFIKAFQLVCLGLEISDPSIVVFFSFYQVKSLSPNSAVLLSSQPNRGLFDLYSSHYKNYKDSFVCVRDGEGCQDVMYFEDGEPLFPFYWTSNPRLIKGAVYERLSDFERETVAYLETFNQMGIKDLLDAEGTPAVLERYLSKLFWISIFFFYIFFCSLFMYNSL
jgi:hypothetical protein